MRAHPSRPPILLAILALLAAFGLMLAAAPADASRQRLSDGDGAARFQAAGSGALTLQGRIVAFGLLPQRGRLVIVDRRGDGYVTFNGRRRLAPRSGGRPRTVRIPRAEGRFYAAGSKISITLAGPHLSVSAAGRGMVRLRGDGQYAVNEGPLTPWSPGDGRARRFALAG